MIKIKLSETILYVSDQAASAEFYSRLFGKNPELNVPGMTEFVISDTCKIGLMPCTSIKKIICPALPDPSEGHNIPRCELYFYVEDVEAEYANALAHGAKNISAPENRNWGDKVCYLADPDGHVIAFAQKL